jgi:hypothetical protein
VGERDLEREAGRDEDIFIYREREKKESKERERVY